MVRGCRVHLQLSQSVYPIQKWHRRTLGLGDFAVSLRRIARRRCWSGASPALGGFRSRVAGIGPQIGFFFPVAGREGYLNLRGYYEFDARNRLEGWTAYVTFSVEAAEQKSAQRKFATPSTLAR
jgi:hypothetical protein